QPLVVSHPPPPTPPAQESRGLGDGYKTQDDNADCRGAVEDEEADQACYHSFITEAYKRLGEGDPFLCQP
ncbi:MAG: hypothetical protein K2I35_08865, partial [Duncaniella sp.]|nr:hypothetical protein [Duncaniella sp.]